MYLHLGEAVPLCKALLAISIAADHFCDGAQALCEDSGQPLANDFSRSYFSAAALRSLVSAAAHLTIPAEARIALAFSRLAVWRSICGRGG